MCAFAEYCDTTTTEPHEGESSGLLGVTVARRRAKYRTAVLAQSSKRLSLALVWCDPVSLLILLNSFDTMNLMRLCE